MKQLQSFIYKQNTNEKHLSRFSLTQLLADIINLGMDECARRKLKFDFRLSAAIPDYITGDEYATKQLLSTMLMSAIRSARLHDITLSVDWHNTSKAYILGISLSFAGAAFKEDDLIPLAYTLNATLNTVTSANEMCTLDVNIPVNVENNEYIQNIQAIDTYYEYSDLLSEYDIILQDGLKYTSGNISQYADVAEIQINAYARTRATLTRLFEENNIKDFGISVHALKSNAKFIGANFLSQLALQTENMSSKQDGQFISYALPLILYEADKVMQGLKIFLERYQIMHPVEGVEDINFDPDINNYHKQLIDYIDNCQPEPAINLINKLLQRNISEVKKNVLNKVRTHLEELDYDDAIEILRGMEQ